MPGHGQPGAAPCPRLHPSPGPRIRAVHPRPGVFPWPTRGWFPWLALAQEWGRPGESTFFGWLKVYEEKPAYSRVFVIEG